MAKTHIENTQLPDIKEEYTEESVAEKLNNKLRELRAVMRVNNEEEAEAAAILEQAKQDAANDMENQLQPVYSAEELAREEKAIKQSFDNQNYMDEAKEITKQQQWLKEYGQSFVQLYQIKEEHDKRGEPEKLVLTEIDLAENRDILTEDQYNKMNADPEGKLRELALRVEGGEDNFDIVMTEYNIPNSDKKLKMQLSFDDDTLAQMNAEKMKRIFEFCEKYGLPTSDMSVHYGYDGSIDVGEELRIQQDRLDEMMAQARDMIEKEGQEKDDLEGKLVEENAKSIDKEFDDIVAANGGVVPEGLSKEDIADGPIIEDSELLAGGKAHMLTDREELNKPAGQSAQAPEPNAPTQNTQAPDPNAPTPASNIQSPAVNVPTAAASNVQAPGPNASTPAQAQPKKQKAITQKMAEDKFEEWIGTSKGLSKRKGYSYYKRHTGWFGRGWAQFVVYDSEDKDNLKEDGRKDKDGHYKWHYSFKLFVKVDENGLHLAYRTPNNKKMDESIIGGIVGQLKDMGYTHVNFPAGIPDAEKSMWRKALAEKGIVPVGIGLDRSKAEGMLKAAKEKLSAEEYSKFRWRLGLQMDKNNKSKGKVVDGSEQAFIDGLINTHKYAAFTDGFTLNLKGKMQRILRERDPEMGAIKKIAAFRTLSHVYDIYADSVSKGIGFVNNPKLTTREKSLIRQLHLDGNAEKLTLGQMEQLFDVLYKHQMDNVKTEMYAQLIEERTNPAIFARRPPKTIINDLYKNARNGCEAINEDLAAKGVDEIGLIKSADVSLEYSDFLNNYWPEYNRRHPTPTKQNDAGRDDVNPGDQPAEKSRDKVKEISKGTVEAVSKDGGKGKSKTADEKPAKEPAQPEKAAPQDDKTVADMSKQAVRKQVRASIDAARSRTVSSTTYTQVQTRRQRDV